MALPEYIDSLYSSWGKNKFHFINLNNYSGNIWDSSCEWCQYFKIGFQEPSNSLDFLKEDLENSVGNSGRSVILFFHYGFDDWKNKWWTKQEQDAFYEVVKAYNILAISHGHTHSFD
jgi:cytolysin (calcineurin-like family phosphatase)